MLICWHLEEGFKADVVGGCFQFLAEVVAEFYDFSAFSPFLTFDCG